MKCGRAAGATVTGRAAWLGTGEGAVDTTIAGGAAACGPEGAPPPPNIRKCTACGVVKVLQAVKRCEVRVNPCKSSGLGELNDKFDSRVKAKLAAVVREVGVEDTERVVKWCNETEETRLSYDAGQPWVVKVLEAGVRR